MASGKQWAARAVVGFGLAAAAAGGYAATHRAELSARYADYRFRSAADPAEKAKRAAELAALGDHGTAYLTAALATGDAAQRDAVLAAAADHFAATDPADPRFAQIGRLLLDSTAGPEPTAALLPLVPDLMKCPDAADRCRAVVRAGLTAPAADARERAVRYALRPDLALTADVAPLLDDPEPEVRRAAMLAVGPAADDAPRVIDDEALFRFLHDSDLIVRDLCAAALKSRGLDAAQVGLARKLSSPDPADRLRLLLDLRFAAAEVVRDPGPWLDRLSRDADPGVRAGAVRVAYECRLAATAWADRVADADPDPTVRKLAGYYRARASEVRQTGATDAPE